MSEARFNRRSHLVCLVFEKTYTSSAPRDKLSVISECPSHDRVSVERGFL